MNEAQWWAEDAERVNRLAEMAAKAGFVIPTGDRLPPQLNADGSLSGVKSVYRGLVLTHGHPLASAILVGDDIDLVRGGTGEYVAWAPSIDQAIAYTDSFKAPGILRVILERVVQDLEKGLPQYIIKRPAGAFVVRIVKVL